jgi:ABC transporter substrate binding protein (PQQ-dependent alcohol dehydrogenase system)
MGSSSTIARAAVFLLAALLIVGRAAAQEPAAMQFVYLFQEDDPVYEPHEGYTGLDLRDLRRPIDGAQTAIREGRVIGRALGLSFELAEEGLEHGESPAAAIRRINVQSGAQVFLLDLPTEAIRAAGQELAGDDLLLFNIRSRSDALRGEACSPVLFHTMPSESMLADALAQYLSSRGWTSVLMLVGPETADKEQAAAFETSARKFSLSIEDTRSFALGNDPRERDQNNIALLSADADYDVVYLADTIGEFGRYVPFSTYLPRPVIGSEGLSAAAWDWTWERHGAPQLNQRFDRVAERRMGDADWAAWAAVRSSIEAIARTGKTDAASIKAFLVSEDVNLDLYKGLPGRFRDWDNQLRQPILLRTHNAVIAWAPLPGFLHQYNTLDSLGKDRPESACKMR